MGKIKRRSHIGDRYGRLVVLEEVGDYVTPNGTHKRQVLCRCDCGNVAVYKLPNLRNGNCQSCGCYKHDDIVRRNREGKVIYKSDSLYPVYDNMMKRCYKPTDSQYRFYGARGIKVCDEWVKDRQLFYAWAVNSGYEKGLQIDRIDSNKDYSPDNCRFVIHKENSRNKRNNVHVNYNGVDYVFSAFCENYNLPYRQTHTRVFKQGWSLDEVVERKWVNNYERLQSLRESENIFK